MKTRSKVLLGLLLLLLAASFWAWRYGPGWLVQFNAQQQQARTASEAEGHGFGRQSDQQGCLDRALTDFNACSGYDCTLQQDFFLKACLEEAAPSAGFCDGVPAYREQPSEDDKTWARHRCWDLDIRGEGCRLLLRQQQYWCGGGVAAE
ncbi:hypothetical protein [Marinobacterium aestuariivivens]|uniref:Uncharacterized protein n=1 Tax=Marinobacterium aestuariivivens TaxID=1698799 RepID=A0ABW1ZZP1_9GAMM